MRAFALPFLIVPTLLLFPGTAIGDAGGDAALKACITYLHSTYSVPMSDAANLHTNQTGTGVYAVSGHATYNGERHGVDCIVKQGRVNSVVWQ